MIGLNVFLVITSAMNAMEKAKTALVLNILRSFLVALPLAYILTNMHAEKGFLISIIATNTLSIGMAYYCFRCLKRLV